MSAEAGRQRPRLAAQQVPDGTRARARPCVEPVQREHGHDEDRRIGGAFGQRRALHDHAERDQDDQIERRRLPGHAFTSHAHEHDEPGIVRGGFRGLDQKAVQRFHTQPPAVSPPITCSTVPVI